MGLIRVRDKDIKILPVFLLTLMLISLLLPIAVLSEQEQYISPEVIKGFKVESNLNENSLVTFTVYVPLRNVNLIYYYANEVSDPSSPLYHHYLNKDQVEKLFYPVEKFNQVLNYLKDSGFNILFTASDSFIVAQGTVSQVKQYLGLSYYLLSNGSESYYTAYGMPKIGGVYIYSSNVTAIFFSHPTDLIVYNKEKLMSDFGLLSNLTYPIEAYSPVSLNRVYNTTTLISKGINGSGYTVGILDFSGDPYIYEQLAYFDKVNNLPPPPSFKVIPIGPYNPGLGIVNEWAYEISLDVEVAHAVAPGANIILYIANGALPLAPIIAFIDQDNKTTTLSQSFGIPEVYYSLINGMTYYFNVVLSDLYYALGSSEGITFTASSGDGGGAGYSRGPLGTPGYPSNSPFVLSVGGTTTYIEFGPNGGSIQTAWSNYGFVPNLVNYGGGGGGVSDGEPIPWYQFGLQTPKSYPNGRQTPDISANANDHPGVYIIDPGNVTDITGGTSEASPLIAAMLTLVAQYSHSRLGLINPVLYKMAENPSIYGKAITPITFGYIIPWVASYGYNLATGWGAPNIGWLAYYYKEISSTPKSGLSIKVEVLNITGGEQPEFVTGSPIFILANVTNNGSPVTTGSFTATIETVQGNLSSVKLSYNPLYKLWIGNTTVQPNEEGIAFINVYGSSGGAYGLGYTMTYLGYFTTVVTYVFPFPVFTQLGYPLVANVTTLFDQQPAIATPITVNIYSYNITNNSYTLFKSKTLIPVNASLLGLPNPGLVWITTLKGNYPIGDLLIVGVNSYLYYSISNGIDLQGAYPLGLYILSPIVAQPGAVSPGQDIIIRGFPLPPYETLFIPSIETGNTVAYDILYGSTIRAELLSPSGKVVSSTTIYYNPLYNRYFGYLHVPQGVSPGLYTILLFADFNSSTLGVDIPGFFFGQIYVSNQISLPKITTSSYYEVQGDTLYIYANITYSNGTEVTYGMYSAVVYPNQLQNSYSSLSRSLEVPLWYNTTMRMWVGNVTLPSVSSFGGIKYLTQPGYYSIPFDILVSGLSYDGVPTNNSLSLEYRFYVQPYSLIANQEVNSLVQPFYSAFKNDVITLNGVLYNDLFIGNNKIMNSELIIQDSNLTGTLYVVNSNITLSGVNANNIILVNSTLNLMNSQVNYVSVSGNSYINNFNGIINSINPPPLTLTINSPKANTNISGIVNVQITYSGALVKAINVYLNDVLLKTFSSSNLSPVLSFTLDTTKYPDGSYNIKVVAMQSDGVNSTTSETVFFQNSLNGLSNSLQNLKNNLNSGLQSLSNSLSNATGKLSTQIGTISQQLTGQINGVGNITYVSLGIGVVALIVAIIAILRRR
jgi:subtilase family serine protease